MNEKLLKPYAPKETEDRILETWNKSGYFNPDNLPGERTETFTIMLPPPNATGTLHIGGAIMTVIEDIMVRFKRMQGKKTLWLPGTDHAAIATNVKVEKEMIKKEKQNRHDIGREAFTKRVEEFVEENRGQIKHQIAGLGASLDWSREAFTLDNERNLAVRTAFKRMYDASLIYRGDRMVNWDPYMKTTVSDDEVVYVEQKDPFYYFKYGPFTIGTVRPETKFGDKYVVMHPDDKRYAEYEHGQKLELEWINGPITATVIKDEAADPEMGSGVMTITPAHSMVDNEIAKRHDLDIEQVIDERGVLLPIAGEFAGTHIKKARAAIIEKMTEKGLVEKVDEDYLHNVATNERGGGIIEPQVMKQWFVDVNKKIAERDNKSLKELMQQAVRSGEVEILPERFEKTYFHWIDNLHDWTISRQLWYGHRIPVWYKGEEIYCGTEAPEGEEWEQDPDTLDTWFSSGLWPFSTLGWPDENAPDFKTYYPTNAIETGYDILFPWVARMILMSQFLLGVNPFKTVYLHGLVRRADGKKISKSLGGNIDPLEIADKWGTDAMRMALIIGVGPGADSKLSDEKLKAYKHFANKVWNITRFVKSNTEGLDVSTKPELTEADQGKLTEFATLQDEITGLMDEYKFHLAGEKLYHYVWHTIADEYIEEAKPHLQGEDEKAKLSSAYTLNFLLEDSLKMLHPFMPFITEEIWGIIGKSDLLMIEPWPQNLEQ